MTTRYKAFLSVLLWWSSAAALLPQSPYMRGIQSLWSGDTVQAVLNFQDCANYSGCSDSAYLYLARIQLQFSQDSAGFAGNMRHFLKKETGSPELMYQTGAIMLAMNYRDADKYLKPLLSDARYKTKAGQLLVDFYLKYNMLDSLLKYQSFMTRQFPDDMGRVRSNLVLAIKKHDLATIESLGEQLCSRLPDDPLGNGALSIARFYRGKLEASAAHALKSDPDLIEDYFSFRPRLFALYKSGRYAELVKEAEPFQPEILEDELDAFHYAGALFISGKRGLSFKIIEKLNAAPFFKFPDPVLAARVLFSYRKNKEAKALLLPLKFEANPEIDELLGSIYRSDDSLIEASFYLKRALEKTNEPRLHFDYGEVALSLEDLKHARKSFEYLHGLVPENNLILERLHQVYSRQGDIPKLMEVLPVRISREPENHALKVELARIFSQKGMWDKAAPLLKQVCTARPDEVTAGLLYSTTLQKLDNGSDAYSVLLKLHECHPENREVLHRILSAPEEMLDDNRRASYSKALLALEPQNTGLRAEYVNILRGSSVVNKEDYIQELTRLYQDRPSDPWILNLLVKEMIGNGQGRSVLPYLENLAGLDNSLPNLITLAGAYMHAGQPEKSLDILEEAYAKAPCEALAIKIYQNYIQKGDSSKALDVLSRHAVKWPDDGEVFLTLSQSLEQTDLERASLFAEKAFKLEDNRGTAYQVSKLRLIAGSLKDGIEPQYGLPSRYYRYQGDSAVFLQGMDAFFQGSFSESARLFESLEDPGLSGQSRTALFRSLQGRKDWQGVLRTASLIPLTSLKLLEVRAWAEARYRTGDVASLGDELRNHPAFTSHDPVVVTITALADYRSKKFSQAEKLFSSVIVPAGYEAEFFMAYGQTLLALEMYSKAERVFADEQLFAKSGDSLFMLRTAAAMGRKDTAKAIEVLQQGSRAYPGNLRLVGSLADITFHQRDLESSLKYSRALNDAAPGNIENLRRIAQIYLIRNEPGKAAGFLESAAVEKNLSLLLLLAKAQIAAGSFEKASKTCARALKINSSEPEPYLFLSQVHEKNGNFSESQKFFSKYSRLVDR